VGAGPVPICDRGDTTGLTGGLSCPEDRLDNLLLGRGGGGFCVL
jgi:hypothetical protein